MRGAISLPTRSVAAPVSGARSTSSTYSGSPSSVPTRTFVTSVSRASELKPNLVLMDLDMPVEVVECPTVREEDGLAMSSRNAHLSEEERAAAGFRVEMPVGRIARYPRGEGKPVQARPDRATRQRLAAAVRPNTRLLYLCNPQNPGGSIFGRAELERLAQFAARHGLVICSDEIHADLLLDAGKPHLPIAALAPEVSRRTLTLASPNKSFNVPGAGCAWAIVEDAALRRAFSADHHATVHDASLFGYIAALAAYRDGEAWLAAQLEYLRGNRDLVERAVAQSPGLAMAHVEATYLAWIDARGLGAADAHAHFLAHGVALSPGAQFGAPGYVRLNFGTQRARLAAALARIASAVASTRSR